MKYNIIHLILWEEAKISELWFVKMENKSLIAIVVQMFNQKWKIKHKN